MLFVPVKYVRLPRNTPSGLTLIPTLRLTKKDIKNAKYLNASRKPIKGFNYDEVVLRNFVGFNQV